MQGMGSHSSSQGNLPDAYQQSAARKGDFFARKLEENAGRAEGVHPSQGGKYVGFGSTPTPAPKDSAVNDLASAFSSGWSRFASVATAAAAQAQTTVSSTARNLDEQYRSGALASTVQSGANSALTTAQQLGQTGWGMLSSLTANVQQRVAGAEGGAGSGDDWGGHAGFDTPADIAAASAAAARGDITGQGKREAEWARPKEEQDSALPQRAGSGAMAARRRQDASKSSNDLHGQKSEWDDDW